MKSKAAFVVGAAVGYVLGTRAGREKFEEIRTKATDLWESDRVQEAVGTAQEKASTLAKEQGGRLAETAKAQGSAVAGKVRGGSQDEPDAEDGTYKI